MPPAPPNELSIIRCRRLPASLLPVSSPGRQRKTDRHHRSCLRRGLGGSVERICTANQLCEWNPGIKATVPAQDLAADRLPTSASPTQLPEGAIRLAPLSTSPAQRPVVAPASHPKLRPPMPRWSLPLQEADLNSILVAEWNGSPRPTTFVLPTSLQIALSASDLKTPGTGQIVVNNPRTRRICCPSHSAGHPVSCPHPYSGQSTKHLGQSFRRNASSQTTTGE